MRVLQASLVRTMQAVNAKAKAYVITKDYLEDSWASPAYMFDFSGTVAVDATGEANYTTYTDEVYAINSALGRW